MAEETKDVAPSEKHLQENKHRAKPYKLRQFRYIKFLDKRWIKKCTKKEKPYLKHYNND